MDKNSLEECAIRMFATLQMAPVTVSYPDGQIAKTDINIRAYMWDNDFITYYRFGPYQLTYREVSRYRQNTMCSSDEITFPQTDTNPYITVLVKTNPVGTDKDFIALSNAIMAKADGKPFENLYVNAINNGIGTFMYCLNDTPQNLSDAKVASFTATLQKIQTRLLKTQHIVQDNQPDVRLKRISKKKIAPNIDGLVQYVNNVPNDMLSERKAQSIISLLENMRDQLLSPQQGGHQRGAKN